MSITSILNYSNPKFKEYRSELAKYPIPKYKLKKFELKAEPQSKNYAIVGTAFDYLLRFTIERNFTAFIESREWVAESAVDFLTNNSSITFDSLDTGSHEALLKKNKQFSKEIFSRFKYVKEIFYYSYVNKHKTIDIDLIMGCLFLAKLDALVRSGYWNLYSIDFFYESEADVSDMKYLIEICDINIFKPKNKLILNPVFGEASSLVGGADADIILDDILIDIKVTKELKITRNYYNQLISYYLLHLIEKSKQRTELVINKLGFYFARYGCLLLIPIDKIGTTESFLSVIDVLKKNLNNR